MTAQDKEVSYTFYSDFFFFFKGQFLESERRIFESTPGSNSLHETSKDSAQFYHIQKSDCQEHS